MHQRISRSNWPYCDSTYPDAFSGEKDSCGVGFIACVEGKKNHWVLTQALRGLSCMEHRGGCGGDSDSGDGCLLYTSPSPRDTERSRMPSSA